MVKYKQICPFHEIISAPTERIQTLSGHRYRDFQVAIQFSKGRENDMGFGLKIEVPSIYREVRIISNMWVKKFDGSLIPLFSRSTHRYDDGRNRGSGGFDLGICRINYSRLQSDCLFSLNDKGESIDQDMEKKEKGVIIFWEIQEVIPSYDERKLLDILLSPNSPLQEMVLPSEQEYSNYKYHKNHLEKINDKSNQLRRQITSLSSEVQTLRDKIPELKRSVEQNEKSLISKKENLDSLMKSHKEKIEELTTVDLLTSLLQMDPMKVEIFQFDPSTLILISEGILKIQSTLLARLKKKNDTLTPKKVVLKYPPLENNRSQNKNKGKGKGKNKGKSRFNRYS